MWKVDPGQNAGGDVCYEVTDRLGRVVARFGYRDDAEEYVALKFPVEHAEREKWARRAAEGIVEPDRPRYIAVVAPREAYL